MQAFPNKVIDSTCQTKIQRQYSFYESPEEGLQSINIQQKPHPQTK